MSRDKPIVRIPRQRIGSCCGGYRKDVVQVVAGWVKWGAIVIQRRLVSGRSNEEDSLIPCCGDRFSQALTKWTASPTGVYDVRTMARGILDTLDEIIVGRKRVRIEGIQSHDLHTPSHADHARAVVANCTDRTRNVRSMSVIIVRIARTSDCVDSVNIINVSIAIVI